MSNLRNPLILIDAARLWILISILARQCASAADLPAKPLPSFEESSLDARPNGSIASLDEVDRMLAPMDGDSRVWRQERDKARLRGLFKVRSWTPQDVFRIGLYDRDSRLRIHVWSEGHGVTILLRPVGAAYRISHEPNGLRPNNDFKASLETLITTDDRRDYRLPNAPYQIRMQDGAVVITKGGVRLMTVPLDGPAKALYVEIPHDSGLRDIALFKSGPVPEESQSPRTVVLDGARPAQLAWKDALLPSASVVKQDDGSIELSVQQTGKANNPQSNVIAQTTVAVGHPGLYELVVKIAEATPGTGIVLLDEKGEPVDGIEFGRSGEQRLLFGFATPRELPDLNHVEFDNRPVACAAGPLWLRLVCVAGVSKCWVSGDGLHWGGVLESRWRVGSWQSIALYARQTSDRPKLDTGSRHIRLSYLQVRKLDGLLSAVPAPLLASAAAADIKFDIDHNESPEAWAARIGRLMPAGTSPSAWRFACTLQAITGRINPDQAEVLLHRAVRENLDELPSLQAKINFLHDAALIWRFYQDSANRQLALWNRLGREVITTGAAADLEQYQRAIMETSLGDPPERSGPLAWPLVYDAICMFYTVHRLPEMSRMERLVTFWNANNSDVTGWPIGNQFERFLQHMNGRGGRRRNWTRRREPVEVTQNVSPPLNRAAINILSELEAATQGQQFADVAHILAGSAAPHDEGLVPTSDDERLFVSFRVALRLLVSHHPELAAVLAKPLGAADQLKIEQTLARGDLAGIEALPTQYFGSAAAANACQWLGDRALAAADLDGALSWYEEGCRAAALSDLPDLAARRRLAAAMLGSSVGEPPTRPIHMGDKTTSPEIAPAQFEAWVAKELSRSGNVGGNVSSSNGSATPLIAVNSPVAFAAAPWAEFVEPEGAGYRSDQIPEVFRQVPWSWQHLGLITAENMLVLCNRSNIASIDLNTAQTRWSRSLANPWSPSPVRPQMTADRVYVRAAGSERSGLRCLDRRSGQVYWTCSSAGAVASDPLWYRGRLFVITVTPAANEFLAAVNLVEIQPETGEVLSRHKIIETVEMIRLPIECQATWVGNRLVAVMSGSVVCADLQGRVLWLRQSAYLPYEIESSFASQQPQPPLTLAGRLYVQQPGSSSIDCLSADTGELLWQRPLLGLRRIFDLRDGQLMAITSSGLAAVSVANGNFLWQRDLPELCNAFARTSSGHFFCAQQTSRNNKTFIDFLWLNSKTGRTDAWSALPLTDNQQVKLGPIAAQGTRVFCCLGMAGQNDQPSPSNPKRLIELRSAGPAMIGEPP